MTVEQKKKVEPKTLLSLFLCFMKIGAFTFGGGYAMLALLENEFVSRRGWLCKDDFWDMTAIAEATPGPVAINSATYIGYRLGGVLGALCATVGVSLPSFVIIYIISFFFEEFLSLRYVAYAFHGIQVGVVYLLLSIGAKLWRDLDKTPFTVVLFLLVLAGMVSITLFAWRLSVVVFLLGAAVLGLAAYGIGKIKNGGRSK